MLHTGVLQYYTTPTSLASEVAESMYCKTSREILADPNEMNVALINMLGRISDELLSPA